MDQQLAMTWVKDNISAFGGDPSNVTLCGESAGGACILAHLTCQSSANLFHKAIVQSGGSPVTMLFPHMTDLEDLGAKFAIAAGCHDQTAVQLRALSVEKLVEVNRSDPSVFGVGKFPFGLMQDGTFVPNSFRQAFLEGKFTRVPMIVGVNRDEYTWFQAMMELCSGETVRPEVYASALGDTIQLLNKLHLNGLQVPAEAIHSILQLYPLDGYPNTARAIAAAIGDGGLVTTAGRRSVRVLRQHVQAVFAYEFDVPETPCPWPEVSFQYGSAHTLELPYIFHNFHGSDGKESPLTEAQQQLSRRMTEYWAAFVHHGNSSPPGGVDKGVSSWTTYNATDDNVMLFQTSEVRMSKDWGKRHNSDFWDQYYSHPKSDPSPLGSVRVSG